MIADSIAQFAFLIFVLFFQEPTKVDGHASLIDPPGRHSGWWNVINNCGDGPNNDGVGRRQNYNGKPDYTGHDCGVCGDAIYIGTTDVRNYTTPRQCEVGGFYYPANPVIAYVQEQVISVTIQVGNNHGGGMQFRLCNNDTTPEVQECFNENLLTVVGAYSQPFGNLPVPPGTTTFDLPSGVGGNNLLYMQLQLPKGVTCYRCTLQFTYLGDAAQMFRTCLDMDVRPFDQLVLLQNQGNGKCLRQAFRNNTATLISSECDIEDVDQYVFTLGPWKNLRNDSIYIGSSAQCLNVDGASTKDGASVIRWTCNRFKPTVNELWSTVFFNAGTHAEMFQIVQRRNEDKCIAVTDGSPFQTKCTKDKNQLWKIVNRSNYRLAPLPSECLF